MSLNIHQNKLKEINHPTPLDQIYNKFLLNNQIHFNNLDSINHPTLLDQTYNNHLLFDTVYFNQIHHINNPIPLDIVHNQNLIKFNNKEFEVASILLSLNKKNNEQQNNDWILID